MARVASSGVNGRRLALRQSLASDTPHPCVLVAVVEVEGPASLTRVRELPAAQ
jgi:hypothetical protein